MLATIAVLASLSGTAFAAVVLTGANVRDSTLTGKDFKDASISTTNFSTTARTQLKAKVGPVGDTGPKGPEGLRGAPGRKGSDGPDAARSYSYITADDTTSFIKPKTTTLINPNPDYDCGDQPSTLPVSMGFVSDCTPYAPFYPHWAYDCNSPFIDYYCGLGNQIGAAGAGATLLQTGANGVVGFTGDENGSFVSLMGSGNIIVTGSLTLLRRTAGYHSRISCQPQIRKSNSADPYTDLGVPTVVSANDVLELVHISVTGGTYISAPTGGDYDYQISCRLLDEYDTSDSNGDWYFISGNASASTTEM